MRFGLWLTAQHPPGLDPARALREHVEQVVVARDLGFQLIAAGQHFLPQPYWMLQNVPLLARLAADSGGMRLATGITLLTLLNPLEVAETFASLDVLCGGRFVAGVGLGYRDVENEAFGVSRGRGPLFESKVDVVRRLLAGEAVTARGPGFRLTDARLALAPKRAVPIWVAANGDAAVRRAARVGDAWLMNPHSGLGELERQHRLFQSARSDAGLTPAEEQPITREVCVRRTDAEAVAVARRWIEGKYASYVAWGQDETMPRGQTLRRPWHELAGDGRFIVGSPETCMELLRQHRARLGVTDVLCRVQWPGLPQHEALESLRMLGKEILPALGAERAPASS